MFGPIQNFVFDLDGTLVKSMESVIQGLGEAVRRFSTKNPTREELLASFGPAPKEVLERWLEPEQVMPAIKFWLEFERSLDASTFEPFEGILPLLEKIKAESLGLGIFTGRDRAGTLRILNHHGWVGTYFNEDQIVCGDDGFRAKPFSDALDELLKRKNFSPPKTLMVGDHPYDVQAGRAAGAKTAAALWDLPEGPTTHRARYKKAWERWNGVDCDLRLASPQNLIEWIELSKNQEPHF